LHDKACSLCEVFVEVEQSEHRDREDAAAHAENPRQDPDQEAQRDTQTDVFHRFALERLQRSKVLARAHL
jgi:hypothetical protein